MSHPLRATLPFLLLGVLFPGDSSAADTALERRIWADPQLSHLRLRVTELPNGRVAVEARAADRATAERARAAFQNDPRVERFQVAFDPRLMRGPETAGEPGPLEAAARALRADAGTREHARLLDSARLEPGGRLVLPQDAGLEPGTERRLARLLLAQPGIEALRFGSTPQPPSRPTPDAPARAAATVDAPSRTRLELDPIQPEAAAISLEEAVPRTRLHVGSAAGDGASTSAPEPSRVPAPETAKAPEGPAESPTEESTGPDPVTGEPASQIGIDTPSPAESTLPPGTPIDLAVEDLLRRALDLQGSPESVAVHVRSGVATVSGEVPDRADALAVRELARNFDGIKRVTGSLALTRGGAAVPMDALPDE